MTQRYARMDGDAVAEVFDFDPKLHESLVVVEVGPDVEPNWLRGKDGSFAAPKPVEITPSESPALTYKADLYRRCSDKEAEAIEMALAAAPVRERRLFESAQYLDHSAPEFATLREHLVEMFGADRAAELLAAS